MKILIIGSGGREHAIASKILQNSNITKIYIAPGNGLTALLDKCENINLKTNKEFIAFAKKEEIDLTIVGPEVPLMDGIVDEFKAKDLAIFGPDKRAAMLEGSKAFAKEFMDKYNVKTAAYKEFNEYEKAAAYIENCQLPIVVKADGLAAGKGVAICETRQQALEALEDFMVKDIFKGSGKTVVIEEFLEGVEASILSITDGDTILPFITAKDHKQIYDGGKGPNTGGMGVLAPNPYCTEQVMNDFKENIMKSTLNGLKNEGLQFCGIIFFGIMITKKGTYLLEYNIRLGDPETQAVLPLMKSDFVDLIQASLNKKLYEFPLEWDNNTSICVVAASKGYPQDFETGFKVSGVNKNKNVFGAGLKLENEEIVTTGGRVLSVQALGNSIEDARNKAYSYLKEINFENIYYRTDIGL